MIIIDRFIISDDLFTEFFCCDLNKCKGCCCIEGDVGAPVEFEEMLLLEDEYAKYEPYMTQAGIKAVEEQGCFTQAPDGSMVTPLIKGRNCAYLYKDTDGIYKCAIEKAYNLGLTPFQKPISCHLYPIRVENLAEDKIALNYDRWPICKEARALGEEKKIPVFRFLKEPIIRAYGEELYNAMEEYAKWSKE